MAGYKVLVIEDQQMNMELIADILSFNGYKVIEAETAEVGIELAKTEKPSLILMDIGLPGIDGYEATRILKKDSNTKEIPIVALTSHAMRGDDGKSISAGCSGYITKPINTREFPKTVAAYLPQQKEETE